MATYTYIWDPNNTGNDPIFPYGAGVVNNGVVQNNSIDNKYVNFDGTDVAFDAFNGVVDTITIDMSAMTVANIPHVWSTTSVPQGVNSFTMGMESIDNVIIILPNGWNGSHYAGGYTGNYYINASAPGAGYLFSTPANWWIGSANVTFQNAPVCFTRGCSVECEGEEFRKVEDLAAGDLVRTLDRGLQPIRWVGSTIVTKETLKQFPEKLPVRIRAGALNNKLDFLVSQQHRIHITGENAAVLGGDRERGVLVAAKSLINDHTIMIDHEWKDVEYYHILFDNHEILHSDGIWTESFQPGSYVMKAADESVRREVIALFPQLEDNADSCYTAARDYVRPGHVRRIIKKMESQ